MRKSISLFSFILLCFSASAQDSYYVKAGFGVGTSTSSFDVVSGDAYKNHMDIFAGQEHLNFGYSHGNWQLETGMGYLHTGVSFIAPNGIPLCGGGQLTPEQIQLMQSLNSVKYTIKNPHLTVPLTISYTLNNKRKLSVSPGVGMEALYNFKGKIMTNEDVESSAYNIHYSYNNFGVAFLVKCEIRYKLCKYFSVWCSPSYQNMVTSLTKKVPGDGMSRIYDRALLVNAGVQYNLHCCHKQAGAKS